VNISEDKALEVLTAHYAHEVVIARYCDTTGKEEIVVNYSLECLECDEVLLDADTK
jgi:hypothetical protein